MTPPFAALLGLLALAPPTAIASRAVAGALAVAGARAELLDVRIIAGPSCPADRGEALRPVAGSGEVPLRLVGTDAGGRRCEAYGWARVRVKGDALVLSRSVAAGEPLEAAVAPGEVELRQGRPPPLASLPPGARAARALAAGAPLLPGDVREGPLPGEAITVVVRAGELELSQEGRAVPCARGRACALLPGNRRVEGRLEAGRLILEAP